MRTIANKITARQMFRFASCTFIGLSMAACAGDDATQGEQQGNNEDKNPAGTTIFSSVDQSDESAPSTRTAIVDHTKGGGAKVNWSATDKVWAKDDNGTWQQSGTAVLSSTGDLSKADFAFTGTYTGATHEMLYTNMPMSGTQPQVEIKAEQTQTVPNNFDHAGESGDFGIATATQRAGGDYKFTLNHKASYLCLIPRSSNEFVHRSKLTKIDIVSDDNIAGTYDIASDGTLTLASGGSKTITLTTGTGFDLDNPADDMDKNAAYAVIVPGTHKLCIRYWLKNDVDGRDAAGNPASISGTVTKIVTMNFEAGKIHDITANLNPRNYPGNNYYMWDAQQPYWYGHEWDKAGYVAGTDQPTVGGGLGSAYPQSNTDPRWHNESYPGYGIQNDAMTPLFAALPNANEMSWYAEKGDPHWDADELWSTFGGLYKGGMWFKKAARIAADNSITTTYMKEISANKTTDLRITYDYFRGFSISSSFLTASQRADYFYLPALGGYTYAYNIRRGLFWSSSATPLLTFGTQEAYSLQFDDYIIYMGGSRRDSGYIPLPFE